MRPLSELLNSIRSGIDQRASVDEVQQKKQLDPEWEAAKDYVDSLPVQYPLLVKKNGYKGVESQHGKLTRTIFDLAPYKGMPLQIIEYTKADGSTQCAWYVLFNDARRTVYRRDI